MWIGICIRGVTVYEVTIIIFKDLEDQKKEPTTRPLVVLHAGFCLEHYPSKFFHLLKAQICVNKMSRML